MKKQRLFLILAAFVLIAASSCQQEADKLITETSDNLFYLQNDENETSLTSSSECDFLKIDHEIIPGELTEAEILILSKAFTRLDFIKTKNGKLGIRQKNGASMNMSESIYRFLKNLVRSHINIKDKIQTYRIIDDTLYFDDNNGSAPEDSAECQPPVIAQDCVPQTIYGILQSCGINSISYADVVRILCENHYYDPEKGVHISNLESALNIFFTIRPVSQDQYSSMSANEKYFMIYDTNFERLNGDEPMFHAVGFVSYNSGYFMAYSYQTSSMCFFEQTDDVTVYMVTYNEVF